MKIGKNNIMTWVIRSSFIMPNRKAFDRKYNMWGRDEIDPGNMPKSLCSMFWTFIAGCIIQIVNWPVLFVLPFSKRLQTNPGDMEREAIFGNPIINVIWQVLAIGALGGMSNVLWFKAFIITISAWNLLWIIPAAMVSVVVAAAAIMGVVWVGIQIYEGIGSLIQYIKNKKSKERDPNGIYSDQFEKYEDYLMALEKSEEAKELARQQTMSYIIGQWFKANKEKVCPIIEYTDEIK